MEAIFKNDTFLRALRREPLPIPPMWLMRQAGRYLPEYRALRQQCPDFVTFMKTPELATQAALQPLARYPLDAAILFSDILTIPDAMGLGLYFEPGIGPKFKEPLTNLLNLSLLHHTDPAKDFDYVLKAIKQTKKELNNSVPLIGFAGSPWTIATYMIENGASKTFSKIKGALYDTPQQLKNLLDLLAKTITDYVNAQIEAGADVIMLFDSWAQVLSNETFLEFSLPFMQDIIQNLENKQIPTILFVKNSGRCLTEIAETGCTCIGLDWTANLDNAFEEVGNQVALQGNLDPCVLYADEKTIRKEVHKIVNSLQHKPGYIFNLGHGVYPDIDPESVLRLVTCVKSTV